jgi:hypothetical protein
MNSTDLQLKAMGILGRIEELIYEQTYIFKNEPDSVLIGRETFDFLRASAKVFTGCSYDEKGFTIMGLRGYVSEKFDSVHVFKKEPAVCL